MRSVIDCRTGGENKSSTAVIRSGLSVREHGFGAIITLLKRCMILRQAFDVFLASTAV